MQKIKKFDTHCHLNFDIYKNDFNEVVKRAIDNRIGMIGVGTNYEDSKKAVELANSHDHIWAVIGLHPSNTSDFKDLKTGEISKASKFDYKLFKDLALSSKKVVAIGECGFDFYHSNYDENLQEQAFLSQLQLASELKKPITLHLRNSKDGFKNAYDKALEIIKKDFSELKGNAHFFAGTKEQAFTFVNLGFTLSFTGVITFTKDYDDLIKNIPLENIMSETDSPFVAPEPFRGKRAEPYMVNNVIKRIAEIKEKELNIVEDILFKNTVKQYNILENN